MALHPDVLRAAEQAREREAERIAGELHDWMKEQRASLNPRNPVCSGIGLALDRLGRKLEDLTKGTSTDAV